MCSAHVDSSTDYYRTHFRLRVSACSDLLESGTKLSAYDVFTSVQSKPRQNKKFPQQYFHGQNFEAWILQIQNDLIFG